MNNVVRYLLVLFVCFFSVNLAIASEKGYLLQPGDVLEVSVWKEQELQRDVLVRPDGEISFPLAGSINVREMTASDLNRVLAEKLSKFISDPVVTVGVKRLTGNRIYVTGKVNKPGDFLLSRKVDVLQALSMAGGLTPFANGGKIQVLRREQDETQHSIAFSYDDVEDGDLSQNILLQPGDVILVP